MQGISDEALRRLLAASTGAQLTSGQVRQTSGYSPVVPSVGIQRKQSYTARPKASASPKPRQVSQVSKRASVPISKRKGANGTEIRTQHVPQSVQQALAGGVRKGQLRSGSVIGSTGASSVPAVPRGNSGKKEQEKQSGIWIYPRGYKIV